MDVEQHFGSVDQWLMIQGLSKNYDTGRVYNFLQILRRQILLYDGFAYLKNNLSRYKLLGSLYYRQVLNTNHIGEAFKTMVGELSID